MNKNLEKRDFLRMPIDCRLRYSVVGDNREFQGKVINLSNKGILFTSRQRLEVGSLLTLVLTPSQTNTPPMHATVKVTRVVSNRVQYEVAGIIRRKFD
ncbi:MAG: PilZ domain-containing protein [Gammaproteobacteria bacterium]|jgi:hypothetical protein|nr:PilZ domain-containing protein [Gammaproteobacteria bacterium]